MHPHVNEPLPTCRSWTCACSCATLPSSRLASSVAAAADAPESAEDASGLLLRLGTACRVGLVAAAEPLFPPDDGPAPPTAGAWGLEKADRLLPAIDGESPLTWGQLVKTKHSEQLWCRVAQAGLKATSLCVYVRGNAQLPLRQAWHYAGRQARGAT